MRSFLFFFVSAAVVAACSASGGSRAFDESDASTPADAANVPETSTGPLVPEGGTKDAANGNNCERALEMGAISISNQACFVNEHVSNRSTKLEFPCAGGAATAVFSGKTFEGTVKGDTITLSKVEVFVFNACNWESTEKITGDLSSGKLQYVYTEKPVKTCPDSPCTAGGTVTVEAGEVIVVN